MCRWMRSLCRDTCRSIFVTEDYYPARLETKQALRMLEVALAQIEKNRATVELARNASDIERIRRAGKMAAVLDIEGSFDLDGDPAVLREMYRLGLRSVQLSAHNWTSNYADSCCSPVKWHGLNDRGRAFIREMNRLGIVINVEVMPPDYTNTERALRLNPRQALDAWLAEAAEDD